MHSSVLGLLCAGVLLAAGCPCSQIRWAQLSGPCQNRHNQHLGCATMHLHCDWASTGKELGLITRGVLHACQCWEENSHIPVILCLVRTSSSSITSTDQSSILGKLSMYQ
ncbi:hypothetical protein DAI22_07g032301 [Oryza sativa Japonica Group]|nr:hypothetical protein DAI22_07g032301 [Oryza sativa Japonica Group]